MTVSLFLELGTGVGAVAVVLACVGAAGVAGGAACCLCCILVCWGGWLGHTTPKDGNQGSALDFPPFV